jgi:hypothetical protein
MSQNAFYLEPLGSPAASVAPSNSEIPAQNNPSDLSEILKNLYGRLELLETRNQILESRNVGLGAHPAPKVSLPEKFNGTVGKCRDFLISVENVFALQPSRYGSDQIKTRFIGTLLSQEALAWFRDVVQNKSYLLDDYHLFVQEFKSLFDDPNAQRHACAALKRLKQSKGSVLVYSSKFRRLAPDTGYNEQALLDIFRAGLSDEVKDVLASTLEEPDNLESFINFCVKIDQRLYDRKIERGQNYHSRTVLYPGSNYKSRETPISGPSQSFRGRPPHGIQNPTPMDLDAVFIKDSKGHKHLSVEEKQRRRDLNLCLYCGESGHDFPVCPKKTLKKNLNLLEIATVRFQDKLSDSSLFISTKLNFRGKELETKSLIDSGANSNFISLEVVQKNSLVPVKMVEPIIVNMADGRSSTIDSYLPLVKICAKSDLSSVVSVADVLIVKDLKFPLILGIPWLRNTNPIIDWKQKILKFPYSGDFYLKERSSNLIDTSNARDVAIMNNNCLKNAHGSYPGMNIKYVENDPSFNSGDSLLKERSSNFYDALTNSNVSLSQVEVEQENAIPKEYADYVEAFNEKDVAILPPQRSFDLAINLKDPEKSPPFLKIYSLSLKEESILKSWIEENLKKGFIRPSKSPAAAPIFFVPKKDSDELRPCIDYRELNNNSVRDGHPLPLISDVFSKFSSATIFTKLDLKGAYNLVRIKSGDEWKAAFRCKYGQFEPLVVQFGLMNAPAVFQRFVNSLFPDLIDIHIVIYLDDILIFSEDMETHVRIVKEVLKRLIDHQLVLKKSKCIFHSRSLTFLGHTITTDGIRMETDKIEAIDKFMVPLNVKKLRSFLGLANYYRRFIKNFSDLALPLTNLTRKSVQFNWSPECQTAFEQLKEAIKRDVVLQHPQLN